MKNEIEITNEVSISTPRISKPKPVKELKAKKRRKRSERKILESRLDALCRLIVVDRDIRCVCPPPDNGHSTVIQCGHLITRSKESVRWSLLNLHAQCSSCNMRHEFLPHYYTNWFIGKFGAEQYASLCADSERIQKLQLYELQELEDQMKKIRNKQLVASLSGEPWRPYFTQAEILSGSWKNNG